MSQLGGSCGVVEVWGLGGGSAERSSSSGSMTIMNCDAQTLPLP